MKKKKLKIFIFIICVIILLFVLYFGLSFFILRQGGWAKLPNPYKSYFAMNLMEENCWIPSCHESCAMKRIAYNTVMSDYIKKSSAFRQRIAKELMRTDINNEYATELIKASVKAYPDSIPEFLSDFLKDPKANTTYKAIIVSLYGTENGDVSELMDYFLLKIADQSILAKERTKLLSALIGITDGNAIWSEDGTQVTIIPDENVDYEFLINKMYKLAEVEENIAMKLDLLRAFYIYLDTVQQFNKKNYDKLLALLDKEDNVYVIHDIASRLQQFKDYKNETLSIYETILDTAKDEILIFFVKSYYNDLSDIQIDNPEPDDEVFNEFFNVKPRL